MMTGIGIDIIEVDRIAQAIRKWGDVFIHHVFTAKEIAYAQKHRYPNEHFAARFAAKEAVLKALDDNSKAQWKDIEILNDKNGKPACHYKNSRFKNKILISLSHTKKYAIASVLITS